MAGPHCYYVNDREAQREIGECTTGLYGCRFGCGNYLCHAHADYPCCDPYADPEWCKELFDMIERARKDYDRG